MVTAFTLSTKLIQKGLSTPESEIQRISRWASKKKKKKDDTENEHLTTISPAQCAILLLSIQQEKGLLMEGHKGKPHV